MIFYDKTNAIPFSFYNNGTDIPDKKDDVEITEEAVEYYQKNTKIINLANIQGDKITLEGIMQYGIDKKSQYQSDILEIDEKLLEIRDKEYLDSLLPIKPMAFGMNSEKELLIMRKLELLQEINNLDD